MIQYTRNKLVKDCMVPMALHPGGKVKIMKMREYFWGDQGERRVNSQNIKDFKGSSV